MPGRNEKLHGFLILAFLVFITVYSAGCMGSAIVHGDPFPDLTLKGNGEKELPPLFNYPASEPVLTDDGTPGIYQPGTILQPRKDSPLFNQDIGVIVINDTGNGRYEICVIVNSEGYWYRLPSSEPGKADHRSIEQIFPVVTGHEDYNRLPVTIDWRPDGNTKA
jgi:hypothetical protein